MTSKPLITIQNLAKTYKGSIEPAVDNIDMTVEHGEVFGLLGPNGAGKTTTISILCNLIQPSSGSVKINNLGYSRHAREIKSLMGVVSQDIALFPTLTARENLQYFAGLYGLPGKTAKNRIEEALKRLDLWEKRNTAIKKYSGGMKRRINLLAGILHKPKLLFLDEPTVGIDVQSRRMIFEYLRELNQEGTTIFYTSHLLEEAEKLCSRVSVIDKGRIILNGSPSALIRSTEGSKSLEDVFIRVTGKKVRD